MRRILYSTMVICLLMALTGLPAYGYGGGGGGGAGGGGEGSGDPTAGMGPSTSGGSIVPAGFTPIDMDFVPPAPPSELSSVSETPVTGGPRQLSEEELQQLSAAFEFIMVTTGGIVIGYATGGAGWSILGQAAAGGTWSGTTSYVLSDDDNAGEQAADAAFQDFAIGVVLNRLPPPAQAAVSQGITKLREQLPDTFNPEGASLSTLSRSYDPHYAW